MESTGKALNLETVGIITEKSRFIRPKRHTSQKTNSQEVADERSSKNNCKKSSIKDRFIARDNKWKHENQWC